MTSNVCLQIKNNYKIDPINFFSFEFLLFYLRRDYKRIKKSIKPSLNKFYININELMNYKLVYTKEYPSQRPFIYIRLWYTT